jgi:hypothetical protein
MQDNDVLEAALRDALWADMQPQPAPGEVPLLAHYTSIQTLERIAQTGEIWFSNPLYMNDVDELRYGITLGLHTLRSHAGLRQACPPPHYNALLDAFDALYTDFNNDSAFDVYVFSCSEHDGAIGDDGLLSMWRGYGGDGNGVGIVFDMSRLLSVRQSPLLVRRVQYLSYEQSNGWMQARLQQFAAALARIQAPVEAMKQAAAALFERIKLFALFTKHRGFHEEREWRLVYLREQDQRGMLTQQLHYAIGVRGIEPRLRFTPDVLVQGATPLLREMVQRIILGPVLATPLALRSVVRMLEIYQPAWAGRVTRSSTPYRAQR